MKCQNCSAAQPVLILTIFVLFLLPLFPPESSAQPAAASLRFGIIPHRSHIGNEQAYSLLIDALEKATGFTINWVGSKSYTDVIENLRADKVDIAYLGPFAYVEAQDRFGVRLIVRTLDKERKEFYSSMIIARKDSGLNSLQDLKGKSFAFTDPKSTSGFLFPMGGLKKAGLSLEDFSRVSYVKRHANSLLAVYNRHVDAGAISSTAQEKADVDFDQIKVLWQSTPIYRGPWVARKDLADKTFHNIQKSLLMLSQDKDAHHIFKDLGTKGFVSGRDSDYGNVRELKTLLPLSGNDQQ